MTDKCICSLPEMHGACPVHGPQVCSFLAYLFGEDAVTDEPCRECEDSGWVFLDDFDRDGNQRTVRCLRCLNAGER